MKERKKVYIEIPIILDFFLGDQRYRKLFSDSMIKKYEFIMTVPSYQNLLLKYHAQDEANKIKFTSIDDRISVYPYSESIESEKYLKNKEIKKIKKKKQYQEFIKTIENTAGYLNIFITRDNNLLQIKKIENLRLLPFEKL